MCATFWASTFEREKEEVKEKGKLFFLCRGTTVQNLLCVVKGKQTPAQSHTCDWHLGISELAKTRVPKHQNQTKYWEKKFGLEITQ